MVASEATASSRVIIRFASCSREHDQHSVGKSEFYSAKHKRTVCWK